jgi:hypothetical protein
MKEQSNFPENRRNEVLGFLRACPEMWGRHLDCQVRHSDLHVLGDRGWLRDSDAVLAQTVQMELDRFPD